MSNVISLGLGSPSSVEHLVTLGLEARVDVLLTGGETGYGYEPPTEATISLIAEQPAAAPSLTTGPEAGGGQTYTYGP